MHTITKAERDRRQYMRTIRRMVRETLGITYEEEFEQNSVWEEWVKLEGGRDAKALIALLESDVGDAFKARAFSILSAPRLDWAPYFWARDAHAHDYRQGGNVCDLPASLLDLGLEILLHNCGVASSHASTHRDTHTQAWEWGTWPYYNAPILSALQTIAEDDPRGISLCGQYELVGYRYWPFDCFINSKVPEKWKRVADERMRDLITREQAGTAKRVEEYEPAVDRYLHFIGTPLYGDRPLRYNLELLTSQVDFVLDLPHTEGYALFRQWRLDRVFLELFVGEDHQERRHRLARSLLLDQKRPFKIHRGNDLAAVRAIQSEFAESDPALAAYIDLALAELRVGNARRQGLASAARAKEEGVLTRMR